LNFTKDSCPGAHSSFFVITFILPPNFLVMRLLSCYILEINQGFLSCPFFVLFLPLFHPTISTLDPGVRQAPKVCSLIPRQRYCEFPINPQICYAHLTMSSSIFCLLPVSLFHFHISAHSTLIWSIFFNASTEHSSRSFYHQTAVAEVWQKLVSCNATTQINLFWQNPPLYNFLIVAAIHPIEYTTTKIM
jgi:hypothetical protein